VVEVFAGAAGRQRRREVSVDVLLQRCVGTVGLGQHVRCRALKQVQLGDLVDDLRDELDRAGAVADDRDTLPGEFVAVVPAGGMKDRALEGVQAGQVRLGGQAQLACGGNEEAGLDLGTIGHAHPPPSAVFVEGRGGDFALVAHVFEHPVLARARTCSTIQLSSFVNIR
jgi:hypothetical protein